MVCELGATYVVHYHEVFISFRGKYWCIEEWAEAEFERTVKSLCAFQHALEHDWLQDNELSCPLSLGSSDQAPSHRLPARHLMAASVNRFNLGPPGHETSRPRSTKPKPCRHFQRFYHQKLPCLWLPSILRACRTACTLTSISHFRCTPRCYMAFEADGDGSSGEVEA